MITIPTKNTSPVQLATYAALLVATITTALSFFVVRIGYLQLVIFCFVFLLAFTVYLSLLKYFIYRKIKLIYKFIYDTKATKREAFFYKKILPQKSLEEVSRDVGRWANDRKDEIELLQKNEQFRKEFLMNLSHELRTPIFTIQGYVQSLLDGALSDEDVNVKFLENASKGIQRLVDLAENLDEISKLESGEINIKGDNFIIQDLIKDVYAELALNASQKKMALELKKGTEVALYVRADKEKIKQVVVNLVENALKYGMLGGKITTGFYQMDEQRVYVEVSDNGSGIPEEHLPRIFERFYRADKSRNRNVGGTGLGLAIVKHIVEAHGQTINVRSKVGVGSSFGFTLDKGKA